MQMRKCADVLISICIFFGIKPVISIERRVDSAMGRKRNLFEATRLIWHIRKDFSFAANAKPFACSIELTSSIRHSFRKYPKKN